MHFLALMTMLCLSGDFIIRGGEIKEQRAFCLYEIACLNLASDVKKKTGWKEGKNFVYSKMMWSKLNFDFFCYIKGVS